VLLIIVTLLYAIISLYKVLLPGEAEKRLKQFVKLRVSQLAGYRAVRARIFAQLNSAGG